MLSRSCLMAVPPNVWSSLSAAAVYVFIQFKSWLICGKRGVVMAAAK